MTQVNRGVGSISDCCQGIYFDHAATTPVDPEVAAEMAKALTRSGVFGNPHSTAHQYGYAAAQAVATARQEVAWLIGAQAPEIVWTSGATETINLAIKGTMRSPRAKGRHILVSALEHKAVLESAKSLACQGVAVEYIQPDSQGLISAQVVRSKLRPDTALVSVMHVNNETGTLTNIAEIADVVRGHGALIHVDAAQSIARIPIDVDGLGVDLLSLSGHKMYGPKGIGALYVRHTARALVEAQTDGGGQEGGLRSGTVPTHQVVGLGVAARLTRERLARDAARTAAMDQRLLEWVGRIDGATPNGNQGARVPGILSVAFQGVEAESLMLALGDIAVSAGSACTTAAIEPSHVLLTLGLTKSEAFSSIRLSLGRDNTDVEIDTVGRRLNDAVTTLRSIAN